MYKQTAKTNIGRKIVLMFNLPIVLNVCAVLFWTSLFRPDRFGERGPQIRRSSAEPLFVRSEARLSVVRLAPQDLLRGMRFGDLLPVPGKVGVDPISLKGGLPLPDLAKNPFSPVTKTAKNVASLRGRGVVALDRSGRREFL